MSHPNNSNISAAPTPIISKAKKKTWSCRGKLFAKLEQ